MLTKAAAEPEQSLVTLLEQHQNVARHFNLSGRRYTVRFGSSRQSVIVHVGVSVQGSDEHMHTPFLEIFVYRNTGEVTVHFVENRKMLPESLCYHTKVTSPVTSNVVGTLLGLLRSLPSSGTYQTCLEELLRLQPDTTAAAEPAQDPKEVLCTKLKARYGLELDPERITYMGKDGIDYDGNVLWNDCGIDSIPVRFRNVTGSFNCSANRLISLRNSPVRVNGGFNCSKNRLTTLEHAPGHVGIDFFCFGNRLTSLDHAPAHVGGGFDCRNNHLPPDTKEPAGVRGRFVLGDQTPARVQGAAEPHTGIAGVFAQLHRQLPRAEKAIKVRTGIEEYPVAYLYTIPTKDGCVRVHLQRPRGDIGYLYMADLTEDSMFVRLERTAYGAVIAVLANARSVSDLAYKLAVAAATNHSRKRTQAASEPQHKLSAFDFAEDLHRRMRDGSPVRIGQRLFLMFSSRLEGRDFVQFHFQLPGDPGEVRVNVHENGVVQSTVYEPPRVGHICQQARVPDIDHGPASVMLKKFLLSLKVNCNTDLYSDYDNIHELLEKLPGLATSAHAAAEPDPPGDHIGTVDDVVKILRTVSRPHNEVRVHGDVRLVYAHVTVVVETGRPSDPELRAMDADAIFVSVWCGAVRIMAKEVEDAKQVRRIGVAVANAERALGQRADLEHKMKVLLALHKYGAADEQPPTKEYIEELQSYLQEEATAASEPEIVGEHVKTPAEVAELLQAHIHPRKDIRFRSTIKLVYKHVTVSIDHGEHDDFELHGIGAYALVVVLWCGPILLWAREVDDTEQVRRLGMAVAATEAALSKKAEPDQKIRVILDLRRRWVPKAGALTKEHIAELRTHIQTMEATAAVEPGNQNKQMFDELVALVPGTKRVVVDGAEVKFGRAKSVVPAYDAEMFVHVTTPSGTTKFRVYEFPLPPGNTTKPEFDVVVEEPESKRKLWLLVRKAQNTRQLLAGIVKYAVLAHKAPFPGGHEVEI